MHKTPGAASVARALATAMTTTAMLTGSVSAQARPSTARAAKPAATAVASSVTTRIKNATVLTVTKGTLTNTDILIQNGKIAQIGKNLATPNGATVVDATGKFIMPGIIDPHSHTMSDAINEGSLSVTSMARITDVLNPTAVNVYRELAGGVTTVNILHGSANTIGGQNATVKLKYGHPVADFVFPDAPPGIKFALGENVTQKIGRQAAVHRGNPRRRAVIRRHAWVRKKCCAMHSHAHAITGRRGTTTRHASPERKSACCHRAAISNWSRWSKCSKASASCTHTRIAPTKC